MLQCSRDDPRLLYDSSFEIIYPRMLLFELGVLVENAGQTMDVLAGVVRHETSTPRG